MSQKKKKKARDASGKADRLSLLFVEAALDFYRLQPWDRINSSDAFLMELPTESHPVVASIVGQDGHEYGLEIHRGAAAASSFLRVLEGEDPRDVVRDASVMSVTFDPISEVALEFRAILDAARFTPSRGQAVPVAFSIGPGKHGGRPTRTELRGLVYALKGVVRAVRSGVLHPAPFDPNTPAIQSISVAGDIQDPEVTTRNAPMPALTGNDDGPTAPEELFSGLEGLPRIVASWALGSAVLPLRIAGDDRTTRALILADKAQGKALAFEIIQGSGEYAAAKALAAMFQGMHEDLEPGIPARLSISPHRLFRYLAPALEAHGVRCDSGVDSDAMNNIIDSLSRAMDDGFGTNDEDDAKDREPLQSWDFSIAPGCMEDWQQASAAIGGRLLDEFDREQPGIDPAIDLYFGRAERIDDLLDDETPLEAFCEWRIAAYRPKESSPTWIEEQLGSGRALSETERMLYEARAGGEVSIYRIGQTKSLSILDATCIFTGRVHRIHPSPILYIGPDGSLAPLRLVSVGKWIFPVSAGPALSPEELQEALEYLQEVAGEPVTPELLRRAPHLLGRLWAWTGPEEQEPPVLTNTDGDLFAPQIQTYKASDPKQLKRYLDQQPDMEWDPEGKLFVWFREKAGSRLGERTLLARIKPLGSRWEVSVNSDERGEAIRSRIESVAGVSFVASREDDAQFPPVPFGQSPSLESPEAVSLVNEFFHNHYISWLDEPLPMLQGRTVREIARSPGGEQEVRTLIESIPAPPGVQVPRAEMLRSLGLDP